MLQADIVVQAPNFVLSYNRYSYVLNNPINAVDPTGYFWRGLMDSISNWWNSGNTNQSPTDNSLNDSDSSSDLTTEMNQPGEESAEATKSERPVDNDDMEVVDPVTNVLNEEQKRRARELSHSEIPEGASGCYNDACYHRDLSESPIEEPWKERGPDIYEFIGVHPLGKFGKDIGIAMQAAKYTWLNVLGIAIENLEEERLGVFESSITLQKYQIEYQTVWPRENLIYTNSVRTETRVISGPDILDPDNPYKFNY